MIEKILVKLQLRVDRYDYDLAKLKSEQKEIVPSLFSYIKNLQLSGKTKEWVLVQHYASACVYEGQLKKYIKRAESGRSRTVYVYDFLSRFRPLPQKQKTREIVIMEDKRTRVQKFTAPFRAMGRPLIPLLLYIYSILPYFVLFVVGSIFNVDLFIVIYLGDIDSLFTAIIVCTMLEALLLVASIALHIILPDWRGVYRVPIETYRGHLQDIEDEDMRRAAQIGDISIAEEDE